MIAEFKGIDSLIMVEDSLLLKQYAAMTTVDGLCLEIGSYQGASAYSILQGLPERYDLICCSMFWAYEYNKFRAFMIQERLWNRVIPVMGDFRRSLVDHIIWSKIAFAFIDHDHTEAGMRDALNMILPQCVPGTILMFHDYGHPEYPAVQRHVDALDKTKFQLLSSEPLMAVARMM